MVNTPFEFIWSVKVFPLASVNWLLVSEATQSKCRPAEAAAESQMPAYLMFAIVPPVPVQVTSSTSNLYCLAEAPTVQISPVSALPLVEYPFPETTSLLSELYTPSVNVGAFDAEVCSVIR